MSRDSTAEIREILQYALLDRDGTVCYLCDKPMEIPGGTSFDHVIPVSQGGAHRLSNMRLTHLKCNIGKGLLRGPKWAGVRPYSGRLAGAAVRAWQGRLRRGR